MKTLFTDYPLFECEYGKAAPLREVHVIGYDGNKYCTVKYNGEEYELKAGYLYRSRRKVSLKHNTLCRWFNKSVR